MISLTSLKTMVLSRLSATHVVTVLVLLLALPLSVILVQKTQQLENHAAGASGLDATITVDPSTPTIVSVFQPGMSQVDNTLRYPWDQMTKLQ